MWTPLHLACVQGHHTIALLLVNAGPITLKCETVKFWIWAVLEDTDKARRYATRRNWCRLHVSFRAGCPVCFNLYWTYGTLHWCSHSYAGADPESRDRSDLSVVQRISRQLTELTKLKAAAELRVSAWSGGGDSGRGSKEGGGGGGSGGGGGGSSSSSSQTSCSAGVGTRDTTPTNTSVPSTQHTVRIDVLSERLKSVQKVLLGPQQRFEEAVRAKNVRIVESLVSHHEVEPGQ